MYRCVYMHVCVYVFMYEYMRVCVCASVSVCVLLVIKTVSIDQSIGSFFPTHRSSQMVKIELIIYIFKNQYYISQSKLFYLCIIDCIYHLIIINYYLLYYLFFVNYFYTFFPIFRSPFLHFFALVISIHFIFYSSFQYFVILHL